MDFKLELVEKSYLPGVCVAQLAREHGINDNLLFTWRQRYSHLLPDEIQRTINKPAPVLPVVVSDMPQPPFRADILYCDTGSRP